MPLLSATNNDLAATRRAHDRAICAAESGRGIGFLLLAKELFYSLYCFKNAERSSAFPADIRGNHEK